MKGLDFNLHKKEHISRAAQEGIVFALNAATGSTLWARAFGGSSTTDRGQAICMDNAGHIKILERWMKSYNPHELFDKLEMPLIEVLAEMEWHGIRIDRKFFEDMNARLARELELIQQDIWKLAVIAVIRTMLNYFLAKDIADFTRLQESGQIPASSPRQP